MLKIIIIFFFPHYGSINLVAVLKVSQPPHLEKYAVHGCMVLRTSACHNVIIHIIQQIYNLQVRWQKPIIIQLSSLTHTNNNGHRAQWTTILIDIQYFTIGDYNISSEAKSYIRFKSAFPPDELLETTLQTSIAQGNL